MDFLSSRSFALCHPERSEGSRARQRASCPHHGGVREELSKGADFRAFADSAIHAFRKNNFDGTKLSVVGGHTQNHNRWYKLRFHTEIKLAK